MSAADPAASARSAALLATTFGDHSQVIAPWPRAPRTKNRPLFDPDVVGLFVGEPPRLNDVDPATLYCTQNWVLRSHVSYYLSREWESTGRTSADMHQRANRYPLVYVDDRDRHIILTGHHRSMAALIDGRPLRARVVGSATDGAVVVTPQLEFSGAVVTPAELGRVTAELTARGLTPDECAERIRFTRVPSPPSR